MADDQPAQSNSEHGSQEATEPELTIRDIVQVLWRRKGLLLGTIFSITLVTAIIVNQLTPIYSAVSKVMIDPRKNQVVDIEAVVSGLPADQESIASEIEVLTSRKSASAVIRKLRLDRDPEFNAALRPEGSLGESISVREILLDLVPEDTLDLVWPRKPRQESALADDAEIVRTRVVDAFLAALSVRRKGRSRVIDIEFKSRDPRTAALAANTLADLYLVAQLDAKFDATKRATEWLNERLVRLRRAVAESERAVERYRRASGLTEGRGVTLATQQVTELNTQIILARTKRAEAEARLRQVQSLLKTSGGAESAAEVLNSPLIQRLREQEAQLQRRAAELSQEFGEKHPRMINLRAEMRDLRRKIGNEVNKIVKNLRNEVHVARVRERTLETNLRRLENRVGDQNRRAVRLRALEREAKANRALYETFLNRFKETNEQQGIEQPDARIISRADTPTSPSFPKKALFIGVAMFGSLFLGIALIALLEHLDSGFRSSDQVEHMMGVPALGLMPAITGIGRRPVPHDFLIKNPTSAYAESVRALHASLLLSNVDKPPKIVLVTSALPGEGKTTLSMSLARTVARMANKKVVLVDCDLRKPKIHAHFRLQSRPGLVEHLAGKASLADVIKIDKPSRAMVVTAGRPTANSMDLLSSDQFREFLQKVSQSADLIILDSPPVMAVSDSRILSRLADKTVFVVRWAETKREVAMAGLRQITDVSRVVAGVVLTMVNVRQHAKYGYGDSGAYYGKYQKYYTG